MLINPFKVSVLIFLILSLAACHPKNEENISVISKNSDSSHTANAQASFISCKGTLIIPASDIVSFSLPSPGILKSVFFAAGSFVNKGDILGAIENIEFLKLQQQYLEAKSEFIYYGEDLKRQGGLAIENATSVKKMQQAQRDYETSEIRFRSLEKQLALIGFDTDSLDADHLSSEIVIYSPVSGYIDKIATPEGTLISAGEVIFIFVKKYTPVIAFELPEKFNQKLKPGNGITFFPPGDSSEIYEARLTFINRQSDASSHLVKAFAIPLKTPAGLIPGMQVSVRIPQYPSPIGK